MYLEMTGLYYWGYAFVALVVWIAVGTKKAIVVFPTYAKVLAGLFWGLLWPLWVTIRVIKKLN